MAADAQLLGIEELDREDLLEKSKTAAEPDRQCRIFLAENWKAGERESRRIVELPWNPGGPHGRLSVLALKPGHSVVRPLWQAMVWFGPFGLLYDFQKAPDEKTKQFLREKYAAEKMRILNRFDYPRPISMAKSGVEPIGPHRFPDVTCTVIDSDGTELPPMRLHELYKIGEFDQAYPPESFGQAAESVEEVKARYEAELSSVAAAHQKEMEEMRRQFAEVAGMVKGIAVGIGKPELVSAAPEKGK